MHTRDDFGTYHGLHFGCLAWHGMDWNRRAFRCGHEMMVDMTCVGYGVMGSTMHTYTTQITIQDLDIEQHCIECISVSAHRKFGSSHTTRK